MQINGRAVRAEGGWDQDTRVDVGWDVAIRNRVKKLIKREIRSDLESGWAIGKEGGTHRRVERVVPGETGMLRYVEHLALLRVDPREEH